MPEYRIAGEEPLWLLIEKQIQKYSDEDFSEAKSLTTSRTIAEELDKTAYNVSNHGGNWLQLKAAIKARRRVGRPFIQDFDKAVSALGLDDIQDTYAIATKIMRDLAGDWPSFLASEHRAEVNEIIGKRKIALTVAKAKELPGEGGIRYLISESFKPQVIMESLGISEDEYKSVKSKVDKELAEKARVQELLASMEDVAEEDKKR